MAGSAIEGFIHLINYVRGNLALASSDLVPTLTIIQRLNLVEGFPTVGISILETKDNPGPVTENNDNEFRNDPPCPFHCRGCTREKTPPLGASMAWLHKLEDLLALDLINHIFREYMQADKLPSESRITRILRGHDKNGQPKCSGFVRLIAKGLKEEHTVLRKKHPELLEKPVTYHSPLFKVTYCGGIITDIWHYKNLTFGRNRIFTSTPVQVKKSCVSEWFPYAVKLTEDTQHGDEPHSCYHSSNQCSCRADELFDHGVC